MPHLPSSRLLILLNDYDLPVENIINAYKSKSYIQQLFDYFELNEYYKRENEDSVQYKMLLFLEIIWNASRSFVKNITYALMTIYSSQFYVVQDCLVELISIGIFFLSLSLALLFSSFLPFFLNSICFGSIADTIRHGFRKLQRSWSVRIFCKSCNSLHLVSTLCW